MGKRMLHLPSKVAEKQMERQRLIQEAMRVDPKTDERVECSKCHNNLFIVAPVMGVWIKPITKDMLFQQVSNKSNGRPANALLCVSCGAISPADPDTMTKRNNEDENGGGSDSAGEESVGA